MPTYYYPSNYGAAEFFAPGTSVSTAGQQDFNGTTQSPAGSYTVVTAPGTPTGPGGALQYQVTFGYTGAGTGTTITTTQTVYSDANHNETYGMYPVTSGGLTTLYPAYFVLTNSPVSASPANPYNYNFAAAGSDASPQFVPTGGMTTDPTCFVSGSRIRTTRGDVAVEELLAGDVAITASGAARPIRWLGHRTIDCRDQPNASAVLPVKISAHAFGPDLPARDLFVSPGHAICIDILGEVLIPAGLLVNNSTIAQVEADTVTYWHVELESHDVLLAENLPAESYLEMGNRCFFSEADVVDLGACPDAPVRTHADFCRPYVAGGPILDAVRARLRARATWLATGGPRVRKAA